MFSEYASRFLQQSNARLSFTQQDDRRPPSRQPLDRRRLASNSRYVQRPGMPNPYANPSSSQSRFPFASRLSRQDPQAPLFYSATDDFQEEDEADAHDRDVADFYALQRSRQHFGPSNLTESSEMDDDTVERLEDRKDGQDHDRDESPQAQRGRTRASRTLPFRDQSMPESEASAPSSKGKGRLVDVNLASTINEEPPESLNNFSQSSEVDDGPPPLQTFRTSKHNLKYSSVMPQETDEEALLGQPSPESPGAQSVPHTILGTETVEPPKHDAFWATLYQISLFSMLGAFVLIWFHTSTPSSKKPMGDTIYSALKSSTNMLLWDTMIAVIVACIWLSLLRHYVRPLVYTMIIAVPIILFSFSLYPLIASYHGRHHGNSIQDRAMRWLSFIPALAAGFWTFSVVKSRHSLAKAISILEFGTHILASSPWLVVLGFATLAFTVSFTWLWMLMFERLFLAGSLRGARHFLLDANAWWLAAAFALQYLWTLSVIAGIQRAATATTVSQWYFHRNRSPQPTSQAVVQASLAHATNPLLGTICLSTFLSLLVRLPLILLPARLSSLLNLCALAIMPTNLATLTNPLTLTSAAIHSQPLGQAARNLNTLNFLPRHSPSTTLLSPRAFRPLGPPGSTLLPYRLAKLLLQATRWATSLALGFGGWVRVAHTLKIAGAEAGIRGSLYAYVVALVAGTIGFAVLGAVENVVGGVLDAVLVCWGVETAGGRGEAFWCRDAGEMFGGGEA